MKFFSVFALTALVIFPLSYAQPPQNVIFYIGDGMGFEQVEAAEIYTGTLMFFNDNSQFPYTADCTTHSANSSVTDSAAAGTALATGIKVNNDVISMAYPGDGAELETLLEYFQAQGKAVGLITTAYLTHATPAAFGAHEPSRNNYTQIGLDLLYQTHPNVLFGGGGNGLTLSAATSVGYTVSDNSSGFLTFCPDGDPLTDDFFSAQFGSGYMPYKEDYLGGTYPYPFLDEMVAKAIEILSADPDGFFLMVEGGRIDHACHSNLIKECVHEVIDLSYAVQTGHNWASSRSDTLILVTADHETGGLTVDDGSVGTDGYPVATWTTTNHTGTKVPVYAWGVNANLVIGTMDNTELFNVCTADITPVMEATNPYPQDGQTLVPIDVVLAWTPGINAQTHRISVWTGIDPVTMVVDNVATAAAQYSLPEGFNPGTTYYWSVDEYDGLGNLLAEGSTWTFTTMGYPAAPTNLTPSDGTVTPVNVTLSWTAPENAEEYFVYLDTALDPAILVSRQTGTTYTPSNLTNAVTYYWKVVALNSAGQSSSTIASFVTEDVPQPRSVYAEAENTVAGVKISGGISSLFAGDNSYEVLQEAVNVPNKNGYSILEHVWTFNLGNAVSAEFYVEAFKTVSSDGDDFRFSYSTDGVLYTDMLTVTALEDTDVPQVYIFPVSPTGTVYIKVSDTNHTRATQSLDILYVDQLYIFASEGAAIKHYKASLPVPANASIDIPLNQILTWTAGDDAVTHNVYFGQGGPDEVAGPFAVSGEPAFDPALWAASTGNTLEGGTAYFWRVDEVRQDGTVTQGDVWRYTTESVGSCTPANLIVDSVLLTTERGDAGKLYGVASVKIVDNCGSLVAGAQVTGNFTGTFQDSGLTAVTGENGVAVFRSTTQEKKPVFSFDVTDVVKDGLVY